MAAVVTKQWELAKSRALPSRWPGSNYGSIPDRTIAWELDDYHDLLSARQQKATNIMKLGEQNMPKINAQRLLYDLRKLRTFGGFGAGVVRPALSEADM